MFPSVYGYLRNYLWQTSLGITACGAAVPCGLIHSTLLALLEIKRATVGCKGKIRERNQSQSITRALSSSQQRDAC